MRVTEDLKQETLRIVAGVAGSRARTFLYGSRLDDDARGGDIDLLIESSPELPLLQRASLQVRLLKATVSEKTSTHVSRNPLPPSA